jgi:tetratricopeptide (TPR) repeat protein
LNLRVTLDPARAAVEEAFAHDRAGREADAIPCYERALDLGLPDGLRQQALLGLGSSLRNVRRHRDAVSVLEGAVAEYPEHGGLRFFLALARWSAGEEREAMRVMGGLALDEADLRGYRRAAALYLDELD